MKNQSVFRRYELKYLITKEQKKRILERSIGNIHADEHGRSTICNLYFDTPEYLLIRHSIEKPVYKEKLRMRTYGTPNENAEVFVELKKKYKSVVYKRRVTLPYKEAKSILQPDCCPPDDNGRQISKEIRYTFEHYEGLEPRLYLSYDREAFYGNSENDFRITFDENIIWRKDDLYLSSGVYGESLLDSSMCLMEVKTSEAIPLWFTKILTDEKIYRTSFSKYGTVYKNYLRNDIEFSKKEGA